MLNIKDLNKMKSRDILLLVAVICITALGVVYIQEGGDGVAFTAATTTIAAVLGYKIGKSEPQE